MKDVKIKFINILRRNNWKDPDLIYYFQSRDEIPEWLENILLFISVFSQKRDLFELLNKKGLSFDRIRDYPLHSSIELNDTDLFFHYLKLKYINQTDDNGFTPLMISIRNDNIEFMNILLTKVSLSEHTFFDKKGNSLLYHSIFSENLDMVENFMDYTSVNIDNETPLHLAVKLRLYDCVELLLSKEDINIKGIHTPLDYAILNRDVKMVKLLLKNGATVTEDSKNLELTLFYKNNDDEIHSVIRKLLSY